MKSAYLKTIVKKTIWMVIGTISCMLGLLGVILPGLPTTPFLLVTIIAYSKGSKRFHTWFTQTKFYKKYLLLIHERRSITRKQKTYLMFWSDIVVSISFVMINQVILRLMLIVLVVVKYWYFHKFVTIIDRSKDIDEEQLARKYNFDSLKGLNGHHDIY